MKKYVYCIPWIQQATVEYQIANIILSVKQYKMNKNYDIFLLRLVIFWVKHISYTVLQ